MAYGDPEYFCTKCKKVMKELNFYTSNNKEKYKESDGHIPICKDCLTMHVDMWNPETYTWILQEIDVPYIPDEWNTLLRNYGNNPKTTPKTLLGRYVSKMKLRQWKDYRWKDNAFLQELANNKIEQTMKRQGYDAQDIAKIINTNTLPVPEKVEIPDYTEEDNVAQAQQTFGTDLGQIYNNEPQDDFDIGLSEDDKIYLRLKWGKMYKPSEWVQLEQLYNQMMESYDIQTAGHIDTLKLVCKTSLKCNQLLDIGDIDGFQKTSKVYDSLMKSGKFTAAQNKAESGEYVDSISELVAICEKDGFIPRYYVDGPQDKVDRTLQDIQTYTRTLVTEEMNMGILIERAVKQIEADKEKEQNFSAENANDDDVFEATLFDGTNAILNDEDFSELRDFEDEQEAADDAFLSQLLKEGELE